MTDQPSLRYSVLDLAPILQGSTPAVSFRNSLDLAQHVERWGYHRFWLAEHHNIPGIASAATSVVIAYVAGGTHHIRVGSGGIMLPNHSPLVIAEQFGTLESLFPGRIDLGIGRAPGGDRPTTVALRRRSDGADTFHQDVEELIQFFEPAQPGQLVRAIPGEGLKVPVYILGSSLFGANLAARLGLPYAFASHFAPEQLDAALNVYRSRFQPSEHLAKPYVMIGVNLFAADTDAEAYRLFTTLQQQFLNLVRGTRSELPPPVDTLEGSWSPFERAHVEQMTRYSAVGSPTTVQKTLERFLAETGADEIIATAQIFDHQARLRSFEIAADVFRRLASRSTDPAA